MTIIIAKSFDKNFLKIFHKKDYEEFTRKIQKTELLHLDIPYSNISIRWICFVTSKENIVPIFVVKKSDKLYGMNLIVDGDTLKIFENKYKWVLEDIESWDYVTF
jgi:hypothetical protein